MFSDVAPILFGDGFEKTMKEHMEAMRCIRKTSHNHKIELFLAAQPRELRVRLIVYMYINDILILAETTRLVKDHTMGLIYLLKNLGFIIGYKQCVLEPTQVIDFLGITVDSTKQELRLPAEKIKKSGQRPER